MKKLFLIIMVLVGSIATTNAQTAYEKSKVLDNTYIGMTLDGAIPMANFDLPFNGGLSVRLGKWITPALGFNIEESLWFTSHDASRYSYKNAVRMNNLGVNFDLDVFQAVNYKPNRMFTLIPEVGFGWLHGFNSNAGDVNDLSAKTAIIVAFNVGQQKAWQLQIIPEVLWNLSGPGKLQFNKNYSQLGLQLGFVYRIKNSYGGHNFKTYDIGSYINTIDELNGTIAALQAELDTIPKVVEVVKEVYINQPTLSRTIVMFAQNSAEIVDTADLDDLAKKDSLIHVKVYGYASPEGTAEYNLKLSQQRADNVAAYLTTKGITVDSSEGLGVVGNNSNRVVIVLGEDIYKNTIETNEKPHKGKMTVKEFRETAPHDGEPIRDHGRQPGKEKEDMRGPQRH